ncbi:hypothetical protein E3N88_04249 [Mikania micrantha]|uniref:Uncharacterized protein n=1 Tax=Mikania micrantha TaxID=192012 RepID=A0A5N6PW10_9ASTR|nr:hypothetical protein E3N88_04249 [Mikania micrantha]
MISGDVDWRSCWLKKERGKRKVSAVNGLKFWVSDRPVKGGGCRSFGEEEGRRRERGEKRARKVEIEGRDRGAEEEEEDVTVWQRRPAGGVVGAAVELRQWKSTGG